MKTLHRHQKEASPLALLLFQELWVSTPRHQLHEDLRESTNVPDRQHTLSERLTSATLQSLKLLVSFRCNSGTFQLWLRCWLWPKCSGAYIWYQVTLGEWILGLYKCKWVLFLDLVSVRYEENHKAPQKNRPTDYAQDDSLDSAWAGHWQETQKGCWRIHPFSIPWEPMEGFCLPGRATSLSSLPLVDRASGSLLACIPKPMLASRLPWSL